MTTLDAYIKSIGEYKRLTQREEQSLARRAQNGDETAIGILVRRNLRFVIKLATEQPKGTGLTLMDLISAGNMGLCHAARKFKPGMGTRFTSYAKFWVKRYMHAELYSMGCPVALPRDWRQRGEKPPFENAKFTPIRNGYDEDDIALRLTDDTAAGDLFQSAAIRDDEKRARGILKTMTGTEQKVVTAKLGLDGSEPKTFVEMKAPGGKSYHHYTYLNTIRKIREEMTAAD